MDIQPFRLPMPCRALVPCEGARALRVGCPAACGGGGHAPARGAPWLRELLSPSTCRSPHAAQRLCGNVVLAPPPRLFPRARILTLASRHVEHGCSCADDLTRHQGRGNLGMKQEGVPTVQDSSRPWPVAPPPAARRIASVPRQLCAAHRDVSEHGPHAAGAVLLGARGHRHPL